MYLTLPLEIRLKILSYCKDNIVNLFLYDEELCQYCFITNWIPNNLGLIQRQVNLGHENYLEKYYVVIGTNIKHGLYKKYKRGKLYKKSNYFFNTKNGLEINKYKGSEKYYRINRILFHK